MSNSLLAILGWYITGAYMIRGKINNPDRKRQLNDFSKLRYGSITPADIDGFIEYRDKSYVFLEIKHGKAPLSKGQRLALQRLVTDISSKPAIIFVGEHCVNNPKKEVDADCCIVREYFYNGAETLKWLQPEREMTLKECIDIFFREHSPAGADTKIFKKH